MSKHDMGAVNQDLRPAHAGAQLVKDGAAPEDMVADEMWEKVEALAAEIMEETRKGLMMRFRFLSAALWHMPHDVWRGWPPFGTDGRTFYFEPVSTLFGFKNEPNRVVRAYLHSILHCVFRHPFDDSGRYAPETLSLAGDILVESVSMEMCEERYPCEDDNLRREALDKLRARFGTLAPNVLCRSIEASFKHDPYFNGPKLSDDELYEYQALFEFDCHKGWAAWADDSRRADDGEEEPDEYEQDQDQQDADEDAAEDEQTRLMELAESPEEDGEAEGAGGSQDDEDSGSAQEGPPQNGGSDEQGQQTGPGEEAAQDDGDDEASGGGQSASEDLAADGDEHAAGGEHEAEELQQALEEWSDISKQIEMDLASHAPRWGTDAGTLAAILQIANRKQYDYADFLRKFSVLAEDMKVNDDEFDYIYYTYGLDTFGNMPLVEPLEYMEADRVREFVIVIDTSGSCSGVLVRRFIERTYDILKETESFTSEVNIHIIQADARVQNDTKITSTRELDEYLDAFKVYGFGGTDFRPAFDYVNKMVDSGEFENLQGLIYFTDGEGTYPKKKPGYDTAFVFMSDTIARAYIPPWAMKVVMDEEDIREL